MDRCLDAEFEIVAIELKGSSGHIVIQTASPQHYFAGAPTSTVVTAAPEITGLSAGAH
jgi:hypothetical protein